LLDGGQGLEPISIVNSSSTFGGLFFGALVGPITVSENGNLNFSSNRDFFPTALGNPGVARIAPLWDDITLFNGANNSVIDHSLTGQYVGVTWSNVRLDNETIGDELVPDTDRSFQVLWFEAPTTIKDVNFNANEIVFSYVAHQAGTSNFGPIFATTGITDGVSRFTPLPGDKDGYITANQSSLLAWESNSYLIFRPVVSNNLTTYEASKEFVTAVPEPATITLLSAILCGLSVRYAQSRRRRRMLSVHAS